MRVFINIIACGLLLAACKKDSPTNNNNSSPIDPNAPVTVGNTTTYGGSYVVKTIGVRQVELGTDASNKLTVATFFGGNNRVVLKAGTGNTVEISNGFVGTLPDAVAFNPDGELNYTNNEIDNSKVMDTVGAACIKLKGFDKNKTGYNQLNIVMCKYMYPANYTGGYYNNLTYLSFTKGNGKTNASFGTDFLKTLFTGSVSVSDILIGSSNTYITEDHIVSYCLAVYNAPNTTFVDLYSSNFRCTFSGSPGTPTYPFATGLKLALVNADNGTVARLDDYDYTGNFTNLKIASKDVVVESADSLSRPFIRITGFDKANFGFNQLRLFIANDTFYPGNLTLSYHGKPATAPTYTNIKDVYNVVGLTNVLASHQWHHY